MSELLQDQFSVEDPDLTLLNHRFGSISLGIRIWNFVETRETKLKVLTSGDGSGESLTTVGLYVVDASSSKMSTTDVLIEEEQNIQMDTTHVGTARFADDDELFGGFCKELQAFIASTSAQDRAAHHHLTTSIMADIQVDVHQFYEMELSADKVSIRVWSEYPSLQDLLEHGPADCLRRRLRPTKKDQNQVNGVPAPEPQIRVRHPSQSSVVLKTQAPPSAPDTAAPIITLAPVAGESAINPSPDVESHSTLAAPVTVIPKNIHTRRPSLGPRLSLSSESMYLPTLGSLNPTSTVSKPGSLQRQRDTDMPLLENLDRRPAKARTYQAPTQSSDRFRWINVPCNNSNWVPQVLSKISQEKGIPDLHGKLLSDQCWASHHNRSRHASSHARFVRPHCKVLPPKKFHAMHSDELLSPSSATEQAQFALYLPYLHWDTFHRLQARAAVIKKRGTKSYVHPIDSAIAKGNSLESKLIWQYLNSKWPLHCRRYCLTQTHISIH